MLVWNKVSVYDSNFLENNISDSIVFMFQLKYIFGEGRTSSDTQWKQKLQYLKSTRVFGT